MSVVCSNMVWVQFIVPTAYLHGKMTKSFMLPKNYMADGVPFPKKKKEREKNKYKYKDEVNLFRFYLRLVHPVHTSKQ